MQQPISAGDITLPCALGDDVSQRHQSSVDGEVYDAYSESHLEVDTPLLFGGLENTCICPKQIDSRCSTNRWTDS